MHNVGGMIGGDSPLSPRGEKYASALPALVLENIGDAPIQVHKRHITQEISFALTILCSPGLDIHSSADNRDGSASAVSQKDMEIFGRIGCRCM